MQRKDRIDAVGALSLTGFSAFLAFNQIVIKLVNAGLQPVFFAGLRSLIALGALWLWMRLRGRAPRLDRADAGAGIAIGLAFSAEFFFLFLALDLTTVTRTAVILYSMPVWLAVAAHWLLPGERIGRLRAIGLLLAFAGVAWAIFYRGGSGAGPASGPSLAGDLCALAAAWGWAAITLLARGTRLRSMPPEMQLFWQVLVSTPVMLVLAPLMVPVLGPLVRDLVAVHMLGLFFQGIVVVAAGFLFWLWLLSIYPAAGVASFAFLTPIFGLAFGWAFLAEPVGLPLVGSAVLVAAGIVLINRRT